MYAHLGGAQLLQDHRQSKVGLVVDDGSGVKMIEDSIGLRRVIIDGRPSHPIAIYKTNLNVCVISVPSCKLHHASSRASPFFDCLDPFKWIARWRNDVVHATDNL